MNKEDIYEQLKPFTKLCEKNNDCEKCIIEELFGDCIFIDPPESWNLGDNNYGEKNKES